MALVQQGALLHGALLHGALLNGALLHGALLHCSLLHHTHHYFVLLHWGFFRPGSIRLNILNFQAHDHLQETCFSKCTKLEKSLKLSKEIESANKLS